MNVEDIIYTLIGILIIVLLITGGWLTAQDAMAGEICRNAGYESGIYDKPMIVCSEKIELFLNTTIEKETE